MIVGFVHRNTSQHAPHNKMVSSQPPRAIGAMMGGNRAKAASSKLLADVGDSDTIATGPIPAHMAGRSFWICAVVLAVVMEALTRVMCSS